MGIRQFERISNVGSRTTCCDITDQQQCIDCYSCWWNEQCGQWGNNCCYSTGGNNCDTAQFCDRQLPNNVPCNLRQSYDYPDTQCAGYQDNDGNECLWCDWGDGTFECVDTPSVDEFGLSCEAGEEYGPYEDCIGSPICGCPGVEADNGALNAGFNCVSELGYCIVDCDDWSDPLACGCAPSPLCQFNNPACNNTCCFYAVSGCTDNLACNYDPSATDDDGSCNYGTPCCDGSSECNPDDCPQVDAIGDCGGTCISDADGDGICDDDGGDDCFGNWVACPDSGTVFGTCNLGGSVYCDGEGGTAECPVYDALMVCNGNCASDADGDGVCDDIDECIGEYDECGECNGPGAIYECGCDDIPGGQCDCDGNVDDECGVCGGDGANEFCCTGATGDVYLCPAESCGDIDSDGDGTCDTIDECPIGGVLTEYCRDMDGDGIPSENSCGFICVGVDPVPEFGGNPCLPCEDCDRDGNCDDDDLCAYGCARDCGGNCCNPETIRNFTLYDIDLDNPHCCDPYYGCNSACNSACIEYCDANLDENPIPGGASCGHDVMNTFGCDQYCKCNCNCKWYGEIDCIHPACIIEDDCGICGGSCFLYNGCDCDCPGGVDDCGICDGDCYDGVGFGCDGGCCSGLVNDECGVCDGEGYIVCENGLETCDIHECEPCEERDWDDLCGCGDIPGDGCGATGYYQCDLEECPVWGTSTDHLIGPPAQDEPGYEPIYWADNDPGCCWQYDFQSYCKPGNGGGASPGSYGTYAVVFSACGTQSASNSAYYFNTLKTTWTHYMTWGCMADEQDCCVLQCDAAWGPSEWNGEGPIESWPNWGYNGTMLGGQNDRLGMDCGQEGAVQGPGCECGYKSAGICVNGDFDAWTEEGGNAWDFLTPVQARHNEMHLCDDPRTWRPLYPCSKSANLGHDIDVDIYNWNGTYAGEINMAEWGCCDPFGND